MKEKLITLSAFALCIAVSSSALVAHHGGTAYDRNKVTNFRATITDFRYVNPHVQIFFDAKDDKGNVKHWNCESINPGMLSKQGWTKRTLKPGDQVTIAAFPAREGGPVCLLQKLILPDGKELGANLLD